MSEWPLRIDGRAFYPVPTSWPEAPSAVDAGDGRPRLFAVSAAVVLGGRELEIRYAHPDGGVATACCRAVVDEGKAIPVGLDADAETWARSIVPHFDDCEGIVRQAEWVHLETLWGDRLRLDREVVA